MNVLWQQISHLHLRSTHYNSKANWFVLSMRIKTQETGKKATTWANGNEHGLWNEQTSSESEFYRKFLTLSKYVSSAGKWEKYYLTQRAVKRLRKKYTWNSLGNNVK